MKISHVRADDALSHTVMAPIHFAEEGGKLHKIEEWSLESVRRPEGLARRNARGDILIDFQGFTVAFPTVLVEGPQDDLLYFNEMDNRRMEVLRLFYHGLQSGRMSSADEMIRSIDVPVRKVPMEPSPEDRKREKKSVRRWIRILVSMGFYLALSTVVFGTLGYTVWRNANYVDLSEARLVDANGLLAAQAWMSSDDVLHVWSGMKAEVVTNIAGERLTIPALVDTLNADGSSGSAPDSRVLVELALADPQTSPLGVAAGHPIIVRLDRDLLGNLRVWLSGLGIPR